MSRSAVIDIETRLNRRSLAASGRSAAPRDIPAPLQDVTAVAVLEFTRDVSGALSIIRLASQEGVDGGEAALAAAVDHDLARIYAGGGELITYNGTHDLSVLRLAVMRARRFGSAGASSWITDGERHRDLMHELAAGGRSPRLLDAAAGLGFAPPCVCLTAREVGGEMFKAELDAVLTLLLHIHLEAQRRGRDATFVQDVLAVGRHIASRGPKASHLRGLLDAPLFASANRTLAP